jgi:hypothetical protein
MAAVDQPHDAAGAGLGHLRERRRSPASPAPGTSATDFRNGTWRTGARSEADRGRPARSSPAATASTTAAGRTSPGATWPRCSGTWAAAMIGALTTADPRVGVAQATIDGPCDPLHCRAPSRPPARPTRRLPQTAYRASPSHASQGDAFAAAPPRACMFQALIRLAGRASGRSQQLRALHDRAAK